LWFNHFGYLFFIRACCSAYLQILAKYRNVLSPNEYVQATVACSATQNFKAAEGGRKAASYNYDIMAPPPPWEALPHAPHNLLATLNVCCTSTKQNKFSFLSQDNGQLGKRKRNHTNRREKNPNHV
jgi:hypothetical protein